ncbi:MAG: DUF3040 domain-containing protein [Actinomycetota bacterium]
MTDAWDSGTPEYEWAILSSMEASLQRGAPRFVRQFEALGHDGIRPRTWAALAVAWVAGAVVLATFTFSLPWAFVGLVVMAAALAFLVAFELVPVGRHRARPAQKLAAHPGDG